MTTEKASETSVPSMLEMLHALTKKSPTPK
jgi:hypothetical protein